MQDAYIFDAVRTPRDCRKPGNPFEEIKPIDLLVALLRALEQRNHLDSEYVDDVLIGAVLPLEDYGINIARAGLLKAGWPAGVSGMTLNRNAASGLSALNLGATKVRAGVDALVIAGGLDSRSRDTFRLWEEGSINDPEWLHLASYIPPSLAADLLATAQSITREEADRYALRSWERATQALREGYFSRSVIQLFDRNGLLLLGADQPRWPELSLEGLSACVAFHQHLASPGFAEIALNHYPELERIFPIHSEQNSAPTADGASLVLLGNQSKGESLGLKPRALIRAASHSCTDPVMMYQGAVLAAQKCLQLSGMEVQDIDLWECNEPFAAIPLYFQKALRLPDDRLNVLGGSIALGKPIAASGSMLLGMLLDELERRDLQTGLVAIAAEGGIGVATLIERV